MTNATHTPGPWAFRMTGWQTNPAAVYSPRRPGAVACIPARTSVPLDEQSANARLIAAAPDLLALLRDPQTESISWLDQRDRILAFIDGENTKAKGEQDHD